MTTPRKPRPNRPTGRKRKLPFKIFQDAGDLTELDLCVFDWIQRYVISLGYPPSVREIVTAFRLSSTKLGYDLLTRLQAYGFIDVDAGIPRGIRIVALPEPKDLAGARLKLWLAEATDLLRKHCPEAPGVSEALRKFSVVTF